MGKAAKAASPEPPKEEEPPHKEEEEEPEQLEGEFSFPDGSEYVGQYLRKGESICFHGDGCFQSGPEVFQGSFDQGQYKRGTYRSFSGSVYSGGFRNGLFDGPGEYQWPDGRVYRGLWQDGRMHGRGQFENFSFGVDKVVEGFSVHGNFLSSVSGQEEARRAFVAEYAGDYAGSAIAALRELVGKVEKKGSAGLGEFLVLPKPHGEEAEDPTAAAERAAVKDLVSGPFPDPGHLSLAALKAFAALFAEGHEQQGRATVFEGAEEHELIGSGRLKCEQLAHRGQGVELRNEQGGACALRSLVLVNVSSEHEAAKAQWKIVHCEEASADDKDAAPVENRKGKSLSGTS